MDEEDEDAMATFLADPANQKLKDDAEMSEALSIFNDEGMFTLPEYEGVNHIMI